MISCPGARACRSSAELVRLGAKASVTSGGSLSIAAWVPVCETPSPPMTMAMRAPRVADDGRA